MSTSKKLVGLHLLKKNRPASLQSFLDFSDPGQFIMLLVCFVGSFIMIPYSLQPFGMIPYQEGFDSCFVTKGFAIEGSFAFKIEVVARVVTKDFNSFFMDLAWATTTTTDAAAVTAFSFAYS